MLTKSPVHIARLRATTLAAAVAASLLAVQPTALACVTPLQVRNFKLAEAELATPASAGTTQVSGIGVFNTGCQPPVGSPPANPGDYPPIDLSGSLDGCWYTYVSTSQFNPSGTYHRAGNRDLRRLPERPGMRNIRDDLHLHGEVHGRDVRGGDPRPLRTQDRGRHRGLRRGERRDHLQGRRRQPQVRLQGAHQPRMTCQPAGSR